MSTYFVKYELEYYRDYYVHSSNVTLITRLQMI